MRTLSAFRISTADIACSGYFNGRNVNCWLPDGMIVRRATPKERVCFRRCRSYLSRPGFLEDHESRDLPVAIDRQRTVFRQDAEGGGRAVQ